MESWRIDVGAKSKRVCPKAKFGSGPQRGDDEKSLQSHENYGLRGDVLIEYSNHRKVSWSYNTGKWRANLSYLEVIRSPTLCWHLTSRKIPKILKISQPLDYVRNQALS